jgi:hypothetical protein
VVTSARVRLWPPAVHGEVQGAWRLIALLAKALPETRLREGLTMTEPPEESVKRIATVLARHHVDKAEEVAGEVWAVVRERFRELVQRHEEEAAQERARRQT